MSLPARLEQASSSRRGVWRDSDPSMCVAHTVITLDDAGNRKPSKRKSTGRIDGLIALAMAIGVAPLQVPEIDVRSMIG